MKPSKRSIGIVGVFAAGVLLSPLAAAQDSSAPSDNRAAQAWRDLQQKTQDNFRQGQQRMRDAMSHVQVTPPQTFRNDTGDELRPVFDRLRRQWSLDLATQLSMTTRRPRSLVGSSTSRG